MTISRLSGLGEATVEYFRGVDLKNQSSAAAELVSVWAGKMRDVQKSPFLPRELVSRSAERLATLVQIRERLRSISFVERNRDTMAISTNEQDVINALDAARRAVESAQELEGDARKRVTIRAALAGFTVLSVVGGGLWFYSTRKR
jgi:hypothetical protein